MGVCGKEEQLFSLFVLSSFMCVLHSFIHDSEEDRDPSESERGHSSPQRGTIGIDLDLDRPLHPPRQAGVTPSFPDSGGLLLRTALLHPCEGGPDHPGVEARAWRSS